jgi:hypothetical protein
VVRNVVRAAAQEQRAEDRQLQLVAKTLESLVRTVVTAAEQEQRAEDRQLKAAEKKERAEERAVEQEQRAEDRQLKAAAQEQEQEQNEVAKTLTSLVCKVVIHSHQLEVALKEERKKERQLEKAPTAAESNAARYGDTVESWGLTGELARWEAEERANARSAAQEERRLEKEAEEEAKRNAAKKKKKRKRAHKFAAPSLPKAPTAAEWNAARYGGTVASWEFALAQQATK